MIRFMLPLLMRYAQQNDGSRDATWAKAIDDSSAVKGTGITRTNSFDQSFDKGPADFDKRHVANILDKLALSSRGQAAAWWRKNG